MKSVPFFAYSVKKYSVSFLVIITIFFYLTDKKKSEYKARGGYSHEFWIGVCREGS